MSFTFSSSESGSSCRCRLDGAAFVPCTSPTSYTGLAAGSHTFEVQATDAAGNSDASPAARTFRVDLTPPTVTSRTPGSGATGVAHRTNVTAVFSEPLSAAAVTSSTFTLRRVSTGAIVSAAVSYNGTSRTATLDPTTDLVPSAQYTATLTGGPAALRDEAGNPLVTTTWSFTTTGIAAPASLAATRSGYPTTTRIDLTWVDRSSNEVRFEIERSTSSTFGVNRVTYRVGAGVVAYGNTTLSPRTTYWYRVYAVSGSGVRSGASNVVSIATR